MAESRTFVCNRCKKALESWSEGNPYFIDDDGKKHYAYHPDHENLEKCIGNDFPHICLSCGYEFKIDSLFPTSKCSKCNSSNISNTYQLSGEKCPACLKGIFHFDHNRFLVS